MSYNKDDHWNYNFKLKVVFNDSLFGPGIIRVMELVKETNSLSQAYRDMGLSPSKGWKIIKNAEEKLGFPLFNTVVGGKGGGRSNLSKEGEDLLRKYKAFVEELNIEAERLYKKHFIEDSK